MTMRKSLIILLLAPFSLAHARATNLRGMPSEHSAQPSAVNNAPLAQAGVKDGYIIRSAAQDVQILDVWLSRKSHVVLEYGYHGESGYRVDFFDTARETRLSPDKERAMAHDNQVLQKEAERLGLHKATDIEFEHDGGSDWPFTRIDGTECVWPYNITFRTPVNDNALMVFSTRPEINVTKYRRSCGGINAIVPLATRYRIEAITFYRIGGDGIYGALKSRPYLIHFHDDGTTRFFHGRSDVALVPTAKIEPLVDQASDSTEPQQRFVWKIEHIIRETLAKQKTER